MPPAQLHIKPSRHGCQLAVFLLVCGVCDGYMNHVHTLIGGVK